jgi:hypothetical protein
MSAPGVVIDIDAVVLTGVTSSHPAVLRRLLEARVHAALMQADGTQLRAVQAHVQAIAAEIASTVMQSADNRGGCPHGS